MAGAKNPAEFLSRHPPDQTQVPNQDEAATEAHVHALAQRSCPKTLSTKEISEAILEDAVLLRMKQALEGGSWNQFLRNTDQWTPAERERLTKLWRVRNELSSTADGLLFRGHRLEVEDQFPDCSATESPEQDRESELPLAAGPSGLRQPAYFQKSSNERETSEEAAHVHDPRE
ncbi:hypothetical protein NDU88_004904 [Pleurodeles waltl]|uniref:Uncharacterized protein n=1 Tax=Pleurodeles waltl TaxID=8319 RepID=A0AAV7RHI5_PLEWA|nr:hypothetical protein NDU88_004904 [Pleurodeles waltl]